LIHFIYFVQFTLKIKGIVVRRQNLIKVMAELWAAAGATDISGQRALLSAMRFRKGKGDCPQSRIGTGYQGSPVPTYPGSGSYLSL